MLGSHKGFILVQHCWSGAWKNVAQHLQKQSTSIHSLVVVQEKAVHRSTQRQRALLPRV